MTGKRYKKVISLFFYNNNKYLTEVYPVSGSRGTLVRTSLLIFSLPIKLLVFPPILSHLVEQPLHHWVCKMLCNFGWYTKAMYNSISGVLTLSNGYCFAPIQLIPYFACLCSVQGMVVCLIYIVLCNLTLVWNAHSVKCTHSTPLFTTHHTLNTVYFKLHPINYNQ